MCGIGNYPKKKRAATCKVATLQRCGTFANGNLYRENEKLSKVNEKLSRENENLRAENRDYKLLRKVFGHKQIDNLLDRAKSEKQSIQRSSRFRNYKDER